MKGLFREVPWWVWAAMIVQALCYGFIAWGVIYLLLHPEVIGEWWRTLADAASGRVP